MKIDTKSRNNSLALVNHSTNYNERMNSLKVSYHKTNENVAGWQLKLIYLWRRNLLYAMSRPIDQC
jgi:hypothetical protein